MPLGKLEEALEEGRDLAFSLWHNEKDSVEVVRSGRASPGFIGVRAVLIIWEASQTFHGSQSREQVSAGLCALCVGWECALALPVASIAHSQMGIDHFFPVHRSPRSDCPDSDPFCLDLLSFSSSLRFVFFIAPSSIISWLHAFLYSFFPMLRSYFSHYSIVRIKQTQAHILFHSPSLEQLQMWNLFSKYLIRLFLKISLRLGVREEELAGWETYFG